MNNVVFRKTMENIRNGDIKLVTNKTGRNYFVWEATVMHQFFFRKFISNRNEKNTYSHD